MALDPKWLGAFGLYYGTPSQEEYERHLRDLREREQQLRMLQLQQLYIPPVVSSTSSPVVDNSIHIKKLADSIASLREVNPVRLTKPMPDYVAPLTGWRGWKVDKNDLVALGQTAVWEPEKAVAAVCTSNKAAGHAAPVKDCACGYWSFKSLDTVQEALGRYSTVAVLGTVDIWGRVIECENGYRSEFAYPKELWLLKPGLEYLS